MILPIYNLTSTFIDYVIYSSSNSFVIIAVLGVAALVVIALLIVYLYQKILLSLAFGVLPDATTKCFFSPN